MRVTLNLNSNVRPIKFGDSEGDDFESSSYYIRRRDIADWYDEGEMTDEDYNNQMAEIDKEEERELAYQRWIRENFPPKSSRTSFTGSLMRFFRTK